MKVFFTLFIVLVSIVAVSYGLECYHCDSVTDTSCGDEYSPKESHLSSACLDLTPPGSSTSAEAFTKLISGNPASTKAVKTGCLKVKNSDGTVVRSCLTADYLEDSDTCEKEDGGAVCACFSDKCNSATSMTASFILPILVWLVRFYA